MRELDLGPAAVAIYTTATTAGLGSGDAPVSFHHGHPQIAQLRAQLAARKPGRWLWARQTHSATVITVAPPHRAGVVGSGDALVVLSKTHIPAVVTADCLPVMVASRCGTIRAAIHAGRIGLLAGIIPATLARIRQLTSQRLYSAFGPHICGHCYEVSPALAAQGAAQLPACAARTSWDTPAIDLAAGASAQLAAAGVEVIDRGPCTLENPELFSYRRDGTDERIATAALARTS